MTDRAFRILNNDRDKAIVIEWIRRAEKYSRVTIDGPQRTLEQNNKMWAEVTEICNALPNWPGGPYTPNKWKRMFVGKLGIEMFMPDEHGEMIPLATGSSDLSIKDFADLITIIHAFRDHVGV